MNTDAVPLRRPRRAGPIRASRLLHPAVAVLLGVFAAATTWYRLGVVTRNTAWAEDSGRFLQDELMFGPVRSIWHPYQGYLHLVPRLLADVAVTQPIERYAVVVAALSCLVLGLVSACVYVLAADVVPQWPLRALLAVVPALVPLGPFEIAGNLANLHWFLLFLAPWVFSARTRTWWGSAGVAVLAALITGTEIQSAVFLPLLLLGIHRRDGLPRRHVVPVAAVAVLGVTAQLVSTVAHPRPPSTNPVGSPMHMALGYLLQPFGGSVADVHSVALAVVDHGWAVLVVPVVVTLAVVLLALVLAPWRSRFLLAALAGGSVVVWVAALVLNPDVRAYWNAETSLTILPFRYAAAASMFLLAAAVVTASVLVARGVVLQVVGWLVVVAVVAAMVLNAAPTATRRSGGPIWDQQVAAEVLACRADPGASATVQAAPVLNKWAASIPCRIVLGR